MIEFTEYVGLDIDDILFELKRLAFRANYDESSDDDEDNEEDQENLMRTKKGELEDWKLLKQTLRSGGEDILAVDLQEKADMLLEKKEELKYFLVRQVQRGQY